MLAVVVATGALVVGLVGAGPAAAHTDLLQASPGPGQRAGGTIDFIDLAFTEPVTEAAVQVLFGGSSLPGQVTVGEGAIIRFELDEPLAQSGTYEVRYQMISYDLDPTESSFSFLFEPDAPQAFRIGQVPEEDTGRNWTQIIATAVLVASLAGLAFLFLNRIESRRRLTAAGSASGGAGSGSDGAGSGERPSSDDAGGPAEGPGG